MLQFPNTPEFTGVYAPVRIEGKVQDLAVEGEIPADIEGAFIRVQPDPAYPPMLGDDIWFNGDGMISSFRFKGGKVDLVQRYVETERLLKQREAGKSLFGRYRNPYSNDPSVSDKVYSTANTNVIFWQDKLLALKEDSLPYAMDPDTLETLGVHDFDGQFTAVSCTAHPVFCPTTGNLLTFSYRARGEETNDIAFYEFDRNGKKINEVWTTAPVSPFIHDFVVTENYVIWPCIPIVSNIENAKKGGMMLQWSNDQDILFGLMRRDGDGSDTRWFRAPNGFPGHIANAFEQDGKVYLDLTLVNQNAFYFFPDETGYAPKQPDIPPIVMAALGKASKLLNRPSLIAPPNLKAALSRVELDPLRNDDGVRIESLLDGLVEFPKIDDRFAGRSYRYSYLLGLDMAAFDFMKMGGSPPPMTMNQLVKFDNETRIARTWTAGPTDIVQEPVFIPRSKDCEEGDGYLLAVRNRLATNTSDLVLIDTARFEEGPIAVVECPFRMRLGLHGNWIG